VHHTPIEFGDESEERHQGQIPERELFFQIKELEE
jgi:hypothetical protein